MNDTDVQALRAEVRGGEPGEGLRGPTPAEADELVIRASRVSAATGLPLSDALDALRDVTGWVRRQV